MELDISNTTRRVVIDDEDYPVVASKRWRACYNGGRTTLYARTGVESTPMHRLILGLAPKSKDPREVHHINGDGLDNRKSNLRICSRKENGAAQRKQKGYKGVWFHAGKWRAGIKKDGTKYYLGRFVDKHDAILMYDLWACELFGDFAVTNFEVVSFG